MSNESKPNPLHRLSEAVAVFLEHGTKQLSKDEVLDKHTGLRDLLEPMFENIKTGAATAKDDDAENYLGEYRLVREIGRGGMGVVYEAEDTSLGRRVALKVLTPHVTQSPRQVERFRRESAAAARLEHPGIVPIYNVGEDGGAHYFAMEYVAGPSLYTATQAVREEYPHFSSGFGDADLAEGFDGTYAMQVVEIVAQTAEALAAAHAGSVIHRDIKPHNLLLTESGMVRVVDFGLAKDLDRATISQSGEVAGTPHYMSPEQITGLRDVDYRTDIYALGVVLYELMTLRCPFEYESTQALMLSISTTEPSGVRKLSPRTPRDVEIICHKAMEKNPAHRYQTAEEMAADLRHFLNHEPIVAQPSSPFTRIAKLVRRRRAASVAVALAVLLPVGALVFYLVDDWRRTETKKVQKRSDEIFLEARDLMKKHLERAVHLQLQPGMMKMSRAMVEEALVALDRLKSHRGRFPSHTEVLGQAYMQLGTARFRFGESELAFADFARGFEIFDRLALDHPGNSRYEFLRAKVLTWRGLMSNELGRAPEAESDHRGAIAVLVRQLEDGGGKMGLVVVKSLLATCYHGLGTTLFLDSKRMTEAIAAFERSLAISASLPEDARNFADMLSTQIDSLRSVGRGCMAQGDWKGAEVSLLDAKKVCEFAISRDENPSRHRRALGRVRFALGRLFQTTRRFGQAEKEFTAAVVVFRAISKDFQELASNKISLARSLRDLGLLQGRLRRVKGAELSLREAVSVIESVPDSELIFYRSVLGSVYAALAQVRSESVTAETFAEVDAIFEKAAAIQLALIKILPKAAGNKHQLALTLQNHAALLLAVNSPARARDAVKKAVGYQLVAIAAQPKNSRNRHVLALHYSLLAEAELQLKNHEGAKQATREVISRGNTGVKFVYSAAQNYARCAALAAIDSGLIPLERDELVEELCKDAVEHARLAIEKKAPRDLVLRNPVFKILHEREDWKRLREE